MSGSELLLALSARKKGSWRQFKEAVDALLWYGQMKPEEQDEEVSEYSDFPIYHTVRFSLQRLSHVEFFSPGCEHGWRISPPLMAVTSNDGDHQVVIVGARSESQLYRLLDSPVGDAVCFTSFPLCPDQIIVRFGDIREIERVGTSLGYRVQRSAPEVLLHALPIMPALAVNDESNILPFGQDWTVEYLDTKAMRWILTQSIEAIPTKNSLVRFSSNYEKHVFAKQGSVYTQVNDLSLGKYQILLSNKQSVIAYNEAKKLLTVPLIFRPPLLIERALILYSGELPSLQRESGTLGYCKIPKKTARIVAALLKQELVNDVS